MTAMTGNSCTCGFCTGEACDCCACRHRRANQLGGRAPALVPDDHPDLVRAVRERDAAQARYEKAHAAWSDAERRRVTVEADLVRELDRTFPPPTSEQRERLLQERTKELSAAAREARQVMDERGREAVDARERHRAVQHRLTQEAIKSW